jgi:GntR family transcriptional regulator
LGKNEKPIKILLDFRSGIPIYAQIVDQVKEQVVRGELQPDDQLPTVRKLSEELRINFNTVARAYRMLDDAGLISTQQGRGTYITRIPDAQVTLQLRGQVLQGMTRRYLADAQRMGYGCEEVSAEFRAQLDCWNSGSLSDEPE